MSGAIAFDDNGFRRTVAAVKRVELMPYGSQEEPYPDTGNDGNYDDWVKVTGAISGVWYPGILQRYTESTDTWADVTGATCHIKGPNGETLTNGSRYRGNIVDTHSGSTAYQAISGPAGAAGGGITVKEVDGSPSQAGVTTFEVDQVTGGKVTVNTATDITLSFLPASATQIGMVNLSNQTMGDGDKTFSDSVAVTTNLTVGTIFGTNVSAGQVYCGGGAALSPSAERFTIDHAGASGGGWRYAVGTNRTTAIADYYTGATQSVVVMCYDNGGTDIILEVGVLQSAAVRPAMKVFLDWTSGGYGYVEAKTRFQVNGTAGVTATQGIGQRCVFTGGICTGFV